MKRILSLFAFKPVTGVHTVYEVYYQKYTNEDANIFDYYLDVAPEFEVSAVDKKSVFVEGSLKNSYKNQLSLSVEEENKGIKLRSLYRTNQQTGEKVKVATINFTDNGANYEVVYSNPMAPTRWLFMLQQPMPLLQRKTRVISLSIMDATISTSCSM